MALAKLNPFAGLPNARAVFTWGLFETANHSFTLLIITLLFPVYFKEVVAGAAPAETAKLWWNSTYAASSLLLVLLSPIVGAIADARGIKRQLLVCTALLCVVATLALALLGPGMVLQAALLFIVGNVAFVLGENLIAAFLPQLCTPSNMGRVSALGWAMGYSGGVVVLLIAAGMMLGLGLKDVNQWKPLFVMAGLWFLLISMPTLLFLKDHDAPTDPQRRQNLLSVGFTTVWSTIRDRRRYTQLFRFLAVFLLYMSVVQVIIANAGLIAEQYGFTKEKLVLFVLQITVVTAIGAVLTGLIQDRFGHRRTIATALGLWVLSTVAMALLPPSGAEWPVWLLGNGLGLGMGMIGTSSRALVGAMTPRHKTAEFFGLWGQTLKLAGFFGPAIFGLVQWAMGSQAAYFMLAGQCGLALVAMLLLIDPARGTHEARAAEQDARASGGTTPG
jgi:MFS transporter, UMF1 family